MGVRGLTRYCRQNEAKTSVEELDLHDVTLAVDFVGFLYYLCEELFSETNASPSWLLLGGCTLRLERYVDTWIKRLRERKVRLVFITDPPQCFGGESHRKGHCLQDRALQKAEQIEQLGQSLEKTLTINTVSSIGQGQTVAVALEAAPSPQQKGKVARTLLQTNGRFPFAREKLRGVLKKHGIGIKTASREADEELGNLVRTGEAFAVLAEDSDFLAMSGVRYIPFGKLSFYEHGQNLEQMRIRARIFSSEMVAESLGLEVKQLVDLALLCGNDFTPLLDNEFDMATMLDFPVQRMQGYLYPTDAARYVADHMPILENPVLGQIEAKKKGFLRALFEIYRFYGHTAAFLKKFPMKIESILPTKKMKLYKKLIDIYDFPPMAIDILETEARGLSQRFDPLASIPGLEDKSLDDLQAPARRLSYLVLDTPVVEEGTVRSCVQVHVAPLEFLRPLISVPIQGRGANAVERMFRSLMFVLLYGDPSGKNPKAGQLAGMLGGKDKKGVAVKNIVYALLVLWKQDRTYLTNASLLDDRLLELLLVASLISFAVDSSKRKTTDGDLVVFDEQLLNMEIYSVVGGYLETLKQLHQLRLLLGTKRLGTDSAVREGAGYIPEPKTEPKKPVSLKGMMKTLPVFAHREEILENVAANQLTIIQGETGCGKSTSVPQFLYDSWARDKAAFDRPVNIYVTQPRRIAAIELANTVARMREGNEFHEDGQVGKVIGYRIGQKHMTSSKTKITYVTTGYMVERIIHDPEALIKITHLVLDEVHERSMDVDLLLLLLKLQLKNHHLRLVIMSATMDAQILIKYLGKALSTRLVNRKPLFVGSKLYPVTNVYLDELANWFPDLWRHCQKEMVLMRDQFRLLSQSHQSANSELAKKAISKIHEKQLIVIEKMVGLLIEGQRHQTGSQSQCILIFLPEVLVDTWCSRASALQRSGRAGRVMPGTAFHLFSETFRDLCMAEYNTPELLRKPLDRIILQLKGQLNQFGVPSALLRQALDAPDLSHIDGAYKLLAAFDAIDSDEEEDSRLTRFGSFVCHLPLSLELCRLLMTGAYTVQDKTSQGESWPLLLNIVILVAILAVPDLFVMPSFYHAHSAQSYLKEMKKNLQAKLKLDGGMWSEPLSIWLFYMETMSEQRVNVKRNLSGVFHKLSISARRYQTLNFLISDLCTRLISLSKGKSGEFEQLLDAKAVIMLTKLDAFASSQRVDKKLLKFARDTVAGKRDEVRILRFLIIQNFGEHLIGSTRDKPSKFADDDLNDTDRVDLKVNREEAAEFKSLSNRDKATLFNQLSRSANPMDELAALAYDENTVSIYSYSTPRNQDEDEENCFSEVTKDTVERMSFPVSLVYYIRGEKFPVNLGMRPNSEERELAFKFRVGGSNACDLTWQQQRNNVKASTGSRSLFSLPIRPLKTKTKKGTKEPKLLAVYADRLFTGDETRMWCTNCTLLPPNSLCYYPIMLLVTAPRYANIQLHMDPKAGEILLVKVGAQDATFPRKMALKVEALATINAVRAALSDALNATVGARRVCVTDLLALSSDSVFMTKESKANAQQCTWQRLAMNKPDKAMLEEGETPARFPELYMA
ncbi:hypothetical protein JG687_00009491 [Phytophthora cactorum]|uniref:Helicase ATP-binding domain-containing protein n=1 Tax=Phytophthora cactorum TaxID=29920 RepID=A0A8T1UCL1_9STRA|nr:hypothetical protein JG687_00009491 [Phytophthora cactorum]